MPEPPAEDGPVAVRWRLPNTGWSGPVCWDTAERAQHYIEGVDAGDQRVGRRKRQWDVQPTGLMPAQPKEPQS